MESVVLTVCGLPFFPFPFTQSERSERATCNLALRMRGPLRDDELPIIRAFYDFLLWINPLAA
jgi:hypothetical protein